MQKKIRLEKQLSKGKSFEMNGEINGEIDGLGDKKREPKVQDIENIVPDVAHEKKTVDRILDKTR